MTLQTIKYYLIGLTIFFCSTHLFGQQSTTGGEQSRTIDSLLSALLRHTHADTNKVKTLNAFAWEIKDSKLDTAMELGKQAIYLAEKLKWNKGRAIAERQSGWFNYLKGKYELALDNYKKTLALCELLISSEDKALTKAGKHIKGGTLSQIGSLYFSQADNPKALEYYLKGLKIAEEVGNKQQVGRTFGNIAGVYYSQANYPKALEYNLKGLKIAEELGDKSQVGRTFGNIASVYFLQANYPKSLEYYLKSLKICEELGDKSLVGRTFGNIGLVYNSQANIPMALEYYLKGLKIAEVVGDKRQVGETFGNIAGVYYSQANIPMALEYYLKALKICEEIGAKNLIGRMLGNLGSIYNTQANYPKALEYYLKALKICEEVGDKGNIVSLLQGLGSLNERLGKYAKAEDFLKRSLSLSKEIGAPNLEKEAEKILSELYHKTKRPGLAFEHYKKYIALRDTFFNEEHSKKLLRSEMNHDFEKKEAITNAEHKVELEKQQAIAAEKNRQQQIIILSVAIGLLLVIVFAAFVFRSLSTTRKQKFIIELKSKEIEEKNKDILDSIRYAKRIQTSLLPTDKYIERILSEKDKSTGA